MQKFRYFDTMKRVQIEMLHVRRHEKVKIQENIKNR